ncbi:MAG: DUF2029 domain-containing protein [Anaerolineales bacterium]|nr:DUF2029 domain-containing protein [Anaerolineales bacterium]
MRKNKNLVWLPVGMLGLFLAIFIGLTIFNYRFSVQNPGGNDFLVYWIGARYWLKEGISPYSEEVRVATQEMILGRPPQEGDAENLFVYPLYSMAFFAPFGLMDFVVARALWTTIVEGALVMLAFLSMRVAGWRVSVGKAALVVLFCVVWYHGVRNIILGQFAVVNALLIVLTLILIQQKQDIPAGILLAFTTSKPTMVFLLVPFIILWAFSTRRWGIIQGAFGGIVVLFLATLALMPNWPLQWVYRLLDYPKATEFTLLDSPLSYLANLMPGIAVTLNPVLHVLAGLYLLVEWVFAWGKDYKHFLWTTGITLVITNLIAYRTATTNYVVLIPFLFLIFRIWEYRWKVMGALAVWSTIILLLVGLWALFITTVRGNLEAPIMYLPVPFFCLLGLWWVRWWAMRPERLLFDELSARLG